MAKGSKLLLGGEPGTITPCNLPRTAHPAQRKLKGDSTYSFPRTATRTARLGSDPQQTLLRSYIGDRAPVRLGANTAGELHGIDSILMAMSQNHKSLSIRKTDEGESVVPREGKLGSGCGDDSSKAVQTRKQWGNNRVWCSLSSCPSHLHQTEKVPSSSGSPTAWRWQVQHLPKMQTAVSVIWEVKSIFSPAYDSVQLFYRCCLCLGRAWKNSICPSTKTLRRHSFGGQKLLEVDSQCRAEKWFKFLHDRAYERELNLLLSPWLLLRLPALVTSGCESALILILFFVPNKKMQPAGEDTWAYSCAIFLICIPW